MSLPSSGVMWRSFSQWTLTNSGSVLAMELFLMPDMVTPICSSCPGALPVAMTSYLCFGFQAADWDVWKCNIVDDGYQNLSLVQKELLLRHHWNSHAGLSAMHNLHCFNPLSSLIFLIPHSFDFIYSQQLIHFHVLSMFSTPSLITPVVQLVKQPKPHVITLAFHLLTVPQRISPSLLVMISPVTALAVITIGLLLLVRLSPHLSTPLQRMALLMAPCSWTMLAMRSSTMPRNQSRPVIQFAACCSSHDRLLIVVDLFKHFIPTLVFLTPRSFAITVCFSNTSWHSVVLVLSTKMVLRRMLAGPSATAIWHVWIYDTCFYLVARTLSLDLLSFAISYANWVHNHLPPHDHGLSPQEVWSGIKALVFICLDAFSSFLTPLQDGKLLQDRHEIL